MATLLTDANLKKFQTQVNEAKAEINKLKTTYLTNVEKELTKSVGKTFSSEYSQGGIYAMKIQRIVDILQGLSSDYTKLIAKSNEFIKSHKTTK